MSVRYRANESSSIHGALVSFDIKKWPNGVAQHIFRPRVKCSAIFLLKGWRNIIGLNSIDPNIAEMCEYRLRTRDRGFHGFDFIVKNGIHYYTNKNESPFCC